MDPRLYLHSQRYRLTRDNSPTLWTLDTLGLEDNHGITVTVSSYTNA